MIVEDRLSHVLYYPSIEIEDPSWLMGAILFWDGISTITPDTKNPYRTAISRELFENGILTPHRLNPQNQNVYNVSERILTLITDPSFINIIGNDHWAVGQGCEHYLHVDKITENLKHELRGLKLIEEEKDGWVQAKDGLAVAYMLILSTEVAKSNTISLESINL